MLRAISHHEFCNSLNRFHETPQCGLSVEAPSVRSDWVSWNRSTSGLSLGSFGQRNALGCASGSVGQSAAPYRRFARPSSQNRVVHVQALFSLRFLDWLRLRKLGSFAEISLSVGLVWLMRNRAARWVRLTMAMDPSVGFVWPKRPAPYRGSFGEQPSIVLFMFKHCFHYDFTIGFVCGSWVRLRKASLSVGFVWLMRNRAADGFVGHIVLRLPERFGFVWQPRERRSARARRARITSICAQAIRHAIRKRSPLTSGPAMRASTSLRGE